MKKRLTLSNFLLTFIILLIGIFFNSCKKDFDLNSNISSPSIKNSNAVTAEDLKLWQKESPVAQFLALDWKNAKHILIDGKKVVKVALLNENRMPVKNKEVTSSSSLKFSSSLNTNFETHPPEVYFVKDTKDSLHSYLLNFIPDDPTKEFGENKIWTGKLYEWNLNSDSLFVHEYNQNKLTNRFILKGNSSTNLSNNNQIKTDNFWSFLGDVIDAIGDFLNAVGYLLHIPGTSIEQSRKYPRGNEWGWPSFDFVGDIFGGGGGGGYNGGGTGGSNFNGGTGWSGGDNFYNYYFNPIDEPRHGGPSVVDPPLLGSFEANDLINYFDIRDQNIKDMLLNNDDMARIITAYLDINGRTQENIDFINWTFNYLTYVNTNITPNDFQDSFLSFLTKDFNIEYNNEFDVNEGLLYAAELEIMQQGLSNSDPIPEMYYKNGLKIDMTKASPRNGYTALGVPRNKTFFWKELYKTKPEMFSHANRLEMLAERAPNVDETWIKYNPTHKSYLHEKLVHHHEGQGKFAYAIPEKVHRKWSKILHDFKGKGAFSKIRGNLNTFAMFAQVFNIWVDIKTGNPDAWVNWYGRQNEIGVIYFDPEKQLYFQIDNINEQKNNSGIVIKSTITYSAFEGYIWDEDEKIYMGILKLGNFISEYNPVTKTTLSNTFLIRN
jgi:hypothetical protein